MFSFKNKSLSPFQAGVLAVVVASALFSSKAIWIKLIYVHDTPPVVLMTLRMLFSIPFFAVSIYRESRRAIELKQAEKMSKRDWMSIILLGFLGYYLASFFDLTGLQYIPTSLERVILFLYPSYVTLFSWIFLKEKIKGSFWFSLLLCYSGVALMYMGDLSLFSLEGNKLWGAFMVLLSGVSYAAFMLLSAQVVNRIGSKRLANYSLLVSSLIIFIHFYLNYSLDDLVVSQSVYGLALVIAIFSTVIPIRLMTFGIARLGASKTGLISCTGPLSTAFLGYVVLGEALSELQMVGMATVVMGGLVLSRKGRPASK